MGPRCVGLGLPKSLLSQERLWRKAGGGCGVGVPGGAQQCLGCGGGQSWCGAGPEHLGTESWDVGRGTYSLNWSLGSLQGAPGWGKLVRWRLGGHIAA